LFRCTASNQKHTAFSEQTSAAVTSDVTDTVKTGLWHCCTILLLYAELHHN